MNDKLFMVELPRESKFAEADPISVEYDYTKFVTCPKCGERVSGGYWIHPREVVLTKHKTPDFLYAYCDNVPFLLSEKAVEAISQAGLKGITCFEEIENVRFKRKCKQEVEPPKYYHIELVRSHITINHQESNIVYGWRKDPKTCPLCRPVPATYNFTRFLSFNTDLYEGYDIFHTYELGGAVFLSEKFVDFYKKSTLSNLCFVPASKYGSAFTAYYLDGDEDALISRFT